MKHQKISEHYQKWIIQFYSTNFPKPVFFIWLTHLADIDLEDQILVNKANKIIAAKSEDKLLKRIAESKLKLPDQKMTKKWLKKSRGCKKKFSITYDLREIESKIFSDKLKHKDIGQITNFINLYDDYKISTGHKEATLLSRKKRLTKIWYYYYEKMYFPGARFAEMKKKYTPPELKINNKKLHKEFCRMLKDFEDNIVLRKKNS